MTEELREDRWHVIYLEVLSCLLHKNEIRTSAFEAHKQAKEIADLAYPAPKS